MLWVRTTSGKKMPCDPDMVTITESLQGMTLILPSGAVIAKATLLGAKGYVPHWATCPKAKEFRK